MLITRPFYDLVTSYLFVWSERIIEVAKERGINFVDLEGPHANKDELIQRLKKHNPSLVVFNGHGADDKITGFDREHVLIQADNDEGLLKSRIVYSRSCSSIKVLGRKCINKGTKAFAGFESGFAIISNQRFSARPKQDPWAKHFLEATNMVPISLLKGNSIEDSFNKSQNALKRSIEYFEAHFTPDHQEYTHVIPWLRYNMSIHKFLGNPDSCI